MNENELQKDTFYWCEHLRDWVKYCGTQRYEGKVYHNFFRAGIGLFYWLDPQEVNLPNTACTRQGAAVAPSSNNLGFAPCG